MGFLQNITRLFADTKSTTGNAQTRSSLTGELGAYGTQIMSGVIRDEYQVDLANPQQRAIIFDKMPKSDGTVKGIIKAYTLPLKNANFIVTTSAEAKDKTAQEIKDFVQANIDGMTYGFKETLEEILSYIQYGFSCFEKVFEIRDGKVWISKLASRKQKTIEKWNFDEKNGETITGIHQRTYYGKTVDIDIPIEKLLVFTLDRQGANYEGESIFRACYRSWKVKQALINLQAAACERYGMGTRFMKVPAAVSDADKIQVQALLESYRAHPDAGIILPEGFEFQVFEGGTGTIQAIQKVIDYFDEQMEKATLTQFMSLGTKGVGSFALSKDKTDFFNMALKATADYVCEIISKHLIRQLVDLNFSNVKIYPILICRDLIAESRTEWLSDLKIALDSKALSPTFEIQEEICRRLELPIPERPEGENLIPIELIPIRPPTADEIRAGAVTINEIRASLMLAPKEGGDELIKPPEPPPNLNNQIPGQEEGIPVQEKGKGALLVKGEKKASEHNNDTCACGRTHALTESGEPIPFVPRRELTATEKTINFAEIKNLFDTEETQYFKGAEAIVKKQEKAISSAVEKIIKSKKISALADIEIPFEDEHRKLIEKTLIRVIDKSANQTAKELKIDSVQIPGVDIWAKTKAAVISEKQATDLKFRIVNAVNNALLTGKTPENISKLSEYFGENSVIDTFKSILKEVAALGG